jgi:hypothetical protein
MRSPLFWDVTQSGLVLTDVSVEILKVKAVQEEPSRWDP